MVIDDFLGEGSCRTWRIPWRTPDPPRYPGSAVFKSSWLTYLGTVCMSRVTKYSSRHELMGLKSSKESLWRWPRARRLGNGNLTKLLSGHQFIDHSVETFIRIWMRNCNLTVWALGTKDLFPIRKMKILALKDQIIYARNSFCSIQIRHQIPVFRCLWVVDMLNLI